MCKTSLLRVTYGSYCITNTKINVLWSQVEKKKKKNENVTEQNLLWQEELMLYLNNEKENKEKVLIFDVRFSAENPTVNKGWLT